MSIYDEALEKLGNTVVHHISEIVNITTHKLSESNEYKLLKQALADYEQLQRDVKRFMKLVSKPTWLNTIESANYDYLQTKLEKVGK